LSSHDRLPTKALFRTRQVIQNDKCPLCHTNAENMLHILRDYPCVAPIWSKLTNSLFPCDLGCDTIFAWLKAMVTHQHPHAPSNIPWSVTFPMVVWCIWSTRNKLVWEATSFDTDTILRKITSTATDLLHVLPSKHLSPTKPIHHIGWTLPSSGFFKLNTDGLAQDWALDNLSFVFPQNILNIIKATSKPFHSDLEDLPTPFLSPS
ncbi:putative ribonuclease h protein, partial [Quercus suber]